MVILRGGQEVLVMSTGRRPPGVILTLVICDIRRKTSNSNQCILINQIQAST